MRGINGKREAKVQFDNDAGLQSDDDDGENEDIGRNGRFRAIEQDDSGSEDEIEETAKAKKRAQFERGVGNVPVEGEEDSTPAPDGFEPFNMKDERARGWFDGAGNFNVESEDVREAWLKDFEEKQTEDTDSCVPDSTVDLTRKGVKRYRQNVVAADEENDDVIDPVHERQVLLRHMIQNENVLGALKRLGKSDDPCVKSTFEAVTDAADRLLQYGHFDVYHDTIVSIERDLRGQAVSSNAGAIQSNVPPDNLWELCWSNTPSSSEPIHGPYSSAEMDAWLLEGYFNVPSSPTCFVRVKGASDPEWINAAEIRSFSNF